MLLAPAPSTSQSSEMPQRFVADVAHPCLCQATRCGGGGCSLCTGALGAGGRTLLIPRPADSAATEGPRQGGVDQERAFREHLPQVVPEYVAVRGRWHLPLRGRVRVCVCVPAHVHVCVCVFVVVVTCCFIFYISDGPHMCTCTG